MNKRAGRLIPFAIFTLFASAVFLQGILAVAACVQQLNEALFVGIQTWERGPDEAGFKSWSDFIAARSDEKATLLYVTRGTGHPSEVWDFYRLSYSLYPRTVWWIAAPEGAGKEWWQAQIQSRAAEYVILDGVEPPDQPSDALRTEFSKERRLIRWR